MSICQTNCFEVIFGGRSFFRNCSKMTNHLLLKLIKEEINIDAFKNWLLTHRQEASTFYNCNPVDFLTYFLNFIHEEIFKFTEPSDNKNITEDDVPKSQQKDEIVVKSRSVPLCLNKSIEKEFNDVPQVHHNSSTPKLSKPQPDSKFNSSHFSPVSPIYNNSNFSSSRNKTVRSTEKNSTFCLSDFIIEKKSTKKKNKNSTNEIKNDSFKRITPTCLNKQRFNNSFKKTNSYSDFNTAEISAEDSDRNRNFLAEERLKIMSRNDLDLNKLSPMISRKSMRENNTEGEEARLHLVSNVKELDVTINLFNFILSNRMVLNINSEIYFLISLIISENHSNSSCISFEEDIKPLEDENQSCFPKNISCTYFFRTIHNIVYFAVKCLESQLDVLKYYDKTTLNFLSENERIKLFSKSLSSCLKQMSEEKPERIFEIPRNNEHANVCFNLDTDNRENFSNELAFHSFRKQRDLFYEILRIWENNHMISDWNFSIGLGGKIRTLLNLQIEPANLIHFCRLFKSQLLFTCEKSITEDDMSQQNIALLTSLPNINKDKLNRLKSRLVVKKPQGSLNYLPLFPEYQEFYKNFITAASNHIFNKHLCDTFIETIIELNNTKFSSADYEESETDDIDPETRKTFANCLKYLRVLSKFLGFILSLPYKSDYSNYSGSLVNVHIKLRQQVSPPLNVKQILVDAIDQGTVVLTVPWIAKYLSMLDTLTLQLPYYISVHKILFYLYKTYGTSEKHLNYNGALVIFTLGWLFELQHFPDFEFFKFTTREQNLPHRNIVLKKSLDSVNIVDISILYNFCPYIEEIKNLLTSKAANKNLTIKHITPITAIHSLQEIAKKRTEQQLEEAFLNNLPVSCRKTIEFVSERVASTCVKHICSEIVPNYKKTVIKDVQEYLQGINAEEFQSTEDSFDKKRSVLKSKLEQKIPNYISAIKDICNKELTNIMKERIPVTIDMLLAINTLPETKSACISIAIKMCKERIKQWIVAHINANIFNKDLDGEIQKFFYDKHDKTKPIFMIPSCGNKKEHNENSLSAAHVLEKIKNLSVNILHNSQDVNVAVVLGVLQESKITLTQRWDVNENINSYICTLLTDVSLLLIVYMPDVMLNDDLKKLFVSIWQLYYGNKDDLFKNLLCSRNFMLLAQPANDGFVWDNFAKFVVFLIQENILSSDSFEFQCTSFYRRNWNETILKNVSYFFERFIHYFKSSGRSANTLQFLEFFSTFCSDL